MKKYFTKKRVMNGVIALIAVVSFINTQAIIKLSGGAQNNVAVSSKNQSAQVLLSQRSCIKILPASNNHTTFIDPANFTENFDGTSSHMFVIGLKIRNTCNQSISIISEGYHSNGTYQNAFQNMRLEDFPNISNQTVASNYSFVGPHPSPISDIYGLSQSNFEVPMTNQNGISPTGDGAMKVTNIPANSEKEFIVYSYANASGQSSLHNTRLSLKNIRWFLTQSYSDNNLSGSDVKTYSLTSAEVEKYTTSYARFVGGQNSDCAEGTVIGYDANGNPIYCGDNLGPNDCAEGTIIGYDANGNPIFCGDEVSENDCAEGTVIGYDSNGNPIYCKGEGGANGNDCAKGTIIGYNKDGSPIYCE